VLALKLAEASVLREETGEQPVALLDDVMSELDTTRQDYVLNHIHGWQVFLTCCDPSPVLRLTGGRIFHVEGGRIIRDAL
jgi:DNA replication and repair protein RecF